MIIINHQAPNLQTEQHDSVVIKQEPPELDSSDTEQGKDNKNTFHFPRVFHRHKTLWKWMHICATIITKNDIASIS